jgi:hypothetical protein
MKPGRRDDPRAAQLVAFEDLGPRGGGGGHGSPQSMTAPTSNYGTDVEMVDFGNRVQIRGIRGRRVG